MKKLIITVLSVLLVFPPFEARAAINANAVWEVRAAGADTQCGGFKTGAAGTDWSQQNGKRTGADVTDISTVDAVANGTTTITSATANFAATIVGNVIYFAGGTGAIAAVCREVTARTNATTITIDAAIAASVGMTMNIGGAAGSPGWIAPQIVAGNIVHMTGAFSISTATPNISGGPAQPAAATVYFIGYNAARWDYGARPTFTVAGGVVTLSVFKLLTTSSLVHVDIDCASQAACTAIEVGNNLEGVAIRSVITRNTTGTAIIGSKVYVENLEIIGGTGIGITGAGASLNGVYVHGATNTGVTLTTGSTGTNVISSSNTGATSDGISLDRSTCINCVAYANGRNGGYCPAGYHNCRFINFIAESNVGTGVLVTTAGNAGVRVFNLATFGNAAVTSGVGANELTNAIAGASSFFVNAPAGNFALNTTAGAGAAARATGWPGVFPGGLTTSYRDIGAAQHADPAGFQTSHASVK